MNVTPPTRREWLVPAALVLFSAVPVTAGALRLAELSSGAAITPDNARFFGSPVPVVAHIVTVTVYGLLGGFQFVPRLRRKAWHRTAGRILVPCGLVAALSGLWLSVFLPRPDDVGDLLTVFRVVFGSIWVACLVLGLVAVRRRDFTRHRAWMIRGYAVGLGAGTQVVTYLIWVLAVGPVDKGSKALVMVAAWLINIVVAEWIIRRRPRRAPAARPRTRLALVDAR
jgi:peptidoglycan biosynthesis protein MviN/MurJ (putative lipid II flippase)